VRVSPQAIAHADLVDLGAGAAIADAVLHALRVGREKISRRDGQNPIALCDDHDIGFVTVTGQILRFCREFCGHG
jgi:hypothetical protein